MRRAAHVPKAARQRGDVLAMDLDQLEVRAGFAQSQLGADLGMRGLDERRLAHAARAPQQRVVCRQSRGEPACIVEQLCRRPVDTLQQLQRNSVDVGDRQEAFGLGQPHEGLCGLEVGRGAARRGNPLQGSGDAVEAGHEVGIERHEQGVPGSGNGSCGDCCTGRAAPRKPILGRHGRIGRPRVLFGCNAGFRHYSRRAIRAGPARRGNPAVLRPCLVLQEPAL